MALDPRSFMKTIETRIGFTADDKALLKANAAWGNMIASQMSEVFYAYLAHDKEMNIILNAKEGRMHRWHWNVKEG